MEGKDDASNKHPLRREESEFRKAELTDSNGNYHIEYTLLMVLRKSTDINKSNENNNFEGKLSIDFSYFGKSSTNDIFLNFYGDVHSVEINGQKVEINYKDRRLYLDRTKLRQGVDARQDEDFNHVTILFSGKYGRAGQGLHHFIDPIDKKEYLYTQFEPYSCNLVFPVFDQPDLKATIQFTLAGHNDWVLLTNENERWIKELDSEAIEVKDLLENELKITAEESSFMFNSVKGLKYNLVPFGRTHKISSYLYAICAGPFYCHTDPSNYKVPLRVFMRESLKDYGEVQEFFRITKTGMEWYKDFFGLPYPFNKYDQIYCPEYNWGAMENVGLVTYNEIYCWKEPPTQQVRSRFCITVLHELAHMWFGNLVTMEWWDDLWLNESFATFISFLCQDQTLSQDYPTTWLSFNNYKGVAFREDQKSTTHPVFGEITDTEKAESNFDAIVYYKGSSLLKQMFYFIGQENFSNGLKSYFKKYAWTNTKFDDFVDKMVEALLESKQKLNFDLKTLSNKWLQKAGLNQIEVVMEEDHEGRLKKFDLKQTPTLSQHPNLQSHMIDILFVYENENKIFQKILVNPEEITSVSDIIGEVAPKAVILNYNDWGYLKWIVDKKSFDYLKDNLLERIPDILTRQLFYRSILELTRDAKISSPEYLDIIIKMIRHETNEDIISNSIKNIAPLIANYLPLRVYQYYSSQMFDLTCELLAKNVNNKEIVLNLIEALLSFAYLPEHAEFLKDWLINGPSVKLTGNTVTIPSNLLTQDHRFSIVAFIHKIRTISLDEKSKLLEAEIERDKNSDRSVRARCSCRSSLPDPSVKAEIWDKLINKPTSESLYNMKHYMAHFAPINQLDIVDDYIRNKFFEDVLKIGNQDYFYLTPFMMYCSPVLLVENEIIEKLEALTEKAKELETLHKMLLELIDDMKRFRKAQSMAEIYLSILNKWDDNQDYKNNLKS